MADEKLREEAVAAMRRINRLWQEGKVEGLAPLVDPDIVTVSPGFAVSADGRELFLAGFTEFLQTSVIREFREFDHRVDVVGRTAVATFRFEMVYEREGPRRAAGRDLWIFERREDCWIAVWRTMLEISEGPA